MFLLLAFVGIFTCTVIPYSTYFARNYYTMIYHSSVLSMLQSWPYTHTHTKTETMRIPERWTNETEVISFIWTINKMDTVPVSIIQNCKCEFCPFPLVIIRPLLLGIQSPHHLHKTADFDWNRLWNSSPKKCVREWYIMWYECLKTHYTIYNIFIWFNDDDQ